MGFTTACCVGWRETASNRLADAGPISPYVDGKEAKTSPSLPLGLAMEEEYTEICGALPAGKNLVLISDGVFEARSAAGELYGFKRSRRLP